MLAISIPDAVNIDTHPVTRSDHIGFKEGTYGDASGTNNMCDTNSVDLHSVKKQRVGEDDRISIGQNQGEGCIDIMSKTDTPPLYRTMAFEPINRGIDDAIVNIQNALSMGAFTTCNALTPSAPLCTVKGDGSCSTDIQSLGNCDEDLEDNPLSFYRSTAFIPINRF